MKGRTREEHRDAARSVLKGAGYAKGGDTSQDRTLVSRGVHEHERNMHRGMKLTDLQLKRGGKVDGHKSKHRADRKPRGGAKVKVVVNAAPKDEAAPMPMPVPKPVPVPVPMKPPMAGPMPGGAPGPGGPPIGAAPGPGMPPGRPPIPPPPGMPMRKGGAAHRASGGSIKVPQSGPDTPEQRALTSDKNFKRGGAAKFPHPMEAGAGSGEGRLEKTVDAKKQARG